MTTNGSMWSKTAHGHQKKWFTGYGPSEYVVGTVRIEPLFEAPTTAMTHIAMLERLDGKAVNWMKQVSDKQNLSLPLDRERSDLEHED